MVLCGIDGVDEVDVFEVQAGSHEASSDGVLRDPDAEFDGYDDGTSVDGVSEDGDGDESEVVDVASFIEGLFKGRQVGVGVKMTEVADVPMRIGLELDLVLSFFHGSAFYRLYRVNFEEQSIYRVEGDDARWGAGEEPTRVGQNPAAYAAATRWDAGEEPARVGQVSAA